MPDLSNLKSETRTKLDPQEIWMGTKWKFVCEKKSLKLDFYQYPALFLCQMAIFL